MNSFRHAGDIGDIIYSMPVMRAKGGGVLLIEAAPYTRQFLTPDKWCGVDELLKRQHYVHEVIPYQKGMHVTFNLNDFRARMVIALRQGMPAARDKHLGHWMCDAHGCGYACMDDPWLSFEDPIYAGRVVFSRSGPGRDGKHVYQNPLVPVASGLAEVRQGGRLRRDKARARSFLRHMWRREALRDCHTAGSRTRDRWMRAVRRQPDSYARNCGGFEERIVLEVWTGGPNCLIHREGVTHGWDHRFELPDL